MPPSPKTMPQPTPSNYTHTTNQDGTTDSHWKFPKKTFLQKVGLKRVESTSVVLRVDGRGAMQVDDVVVGEERGKGKREV